MSRPKFQLIVISLLVLILGAVAIPVYLNYQRENQPLIPTGMFPTPVTYSDFQKKMLSRGYMRNKEDHKWYSIMRSYQEHRCQSVGPPLEATFYLCQSPLTDGVEDER